MKKPTKKEIKLVLEEGLKMVEKSDFISDVLRRDLHHKNDKNQTQLTQSFDNILKSDNLELIADTKRFIKQQVQTLVKEKAVQESVLGEDFKNFSITVKKVNLPMIENKDGIYADNFNESDLGSFRVIRMHKEQKEELTLEESLLKWMRSEKKNGLWTGSKGMEKDVEFYDVDVVYQLCDNIKKGLI